MGVTINRGPVLRRIGTSMLGRSWYRSLSGPGGVASPLLTGLVSYWKLEEASGTRNDSHGTNHLTDNNTVTQAVGKLGNAAQFVAANSEWLSIVDNATLGFTTAMSASFWVYRDDLDINTAFLGKWTYQTDGEWAIQSGQAVGAGITIFIAISAGDDGGGCRMDFNDVDMLISTWHHVVVIYDGSQAGDANRLKVYVDGAQRTLTVGAGAVPAALRDGTADLNLGKLGGDLLRYYDGRMDAVGLWSRVLTAAEVATLYNAGSGVEYPF